MGNEERTAKAAHGRIRTETAMVSPTKSLPTQRERAQPTDAGAGLAVGLGAAVTALLLAIGVAIVALTAHPSPLGSVNVPVAHAAQQTTQAVVAGEPDQSSETSP
jgi:hypothetical protein